MIRARIVTDGGAHWIDCAIRDISAFGAGIILPAEHVLPKRVFLIVMRDGIAHEAEVRWQTRRNLGVLFHRTFPLDQEMPAEFQFLKQLAEGGAGQSEGATAFFGNLASSYKGFRISVIRENGGYGACAQKIDGTVVCGFTIGERVTAKAYDTVDGAVAAARAAIDTGSM